MVIICSACSQRTLPPSWNKLLAGVVHHLLGLVVGQDEGGLSGGVGGNLVLLVDEEDESD